MVILLIESVLEDKAKDFDVNLTTTVLSDSGINSSDSTLDDVFLGGLVKMCCSMVSGGSMARPFA